MIYAAMLIAEKSTKYLEQLRTITKNILQCLKENKTIDTEEIWAFLREYPNYDCSKPYNYLGSKLNIIQLSVLANDIELCKYLIDDRKAIAASMNVNYACRKGYTEITELLIRNYKEPKEEDIVLWKQTAMLNGHNSIAYLIDRVLNGLYIKFTKSNTDYFIRVITTAIKYTPGNGYMSKSSDCRPTKIILEEILDQFSRLGYMSYTLEYLNVLQKAVRDYLSINKLFHLGAEDIITTALNYYRSYKDGIKTTDKRTLEGALLVVI